MSVEVTRVNPEELYRQFSPTLYRRAYEENMSLSMYLENENPESAYKDGLDAFSRLLQVANIKVRNLPEMGVYSDPFTKFLPGAEDGITEEDARRRRALLPEWVARVWRRAVVTHRAAPTYGSDAEGLNTIARPFADNTQARWDKELAPTIPVSELVSMTTPISGDAYRTYYLIDDPDQTRKVRVTEGSEIPRFVLASKQHDIRAYKYGGALQMTYEQMRRSRINKVERHIQRMAVQSEVDKVGTILDILINGDGNTGTAATVYRMILDGLDADATANQLTLDAWLAFKMKFINPYTLTTVLARDTVAHQLLTLSTGTANVPLVSIGQASGFGAFFQPINPGLNAPVGLGWTADAPANKIVGFDNRQAVERIVEIGANINEVELFIGNQTQLMTMTEVEGFGKDDLDAAKILDLSQ
jgi:hypothetical protein